ncbi:MAG: SH3 domain-containing protein, partial [Anaerolineae bacterium]|nr:SH3 domain-containing protein [Anaerolineae bacterium]
MLFRKGLMFFLSLLVSVVAVAQDDSCPAFVQTALETVAMSCGELGRNEACYGNNRVEANFWQEQADLVFNAPSDRVPLVDVRQIATAPLSIDQQIWGVAVLNVQANVPDTLPGRAVTMLLMGDAQIRNGVAPDEVNAGVTPVRGIIRSGANLRSMPATTSNIIGAVAAGDEVSIVGLNE